MTPGRPASGWTPSAWHLERLPALEQESAGVEAEHLRLEAQAGQLRRDVDVHTLRLEDVDRARQRLKELEAQASVAVQERGAYEVLVDAFGRNGVPARLIEAALPDLESEANELLARLSDGRLSLFLETQRTTARGDVRETLEIRIHDGVGTRSYELFSGGEAFRINFALRIALAKLLATRAGAPLRTLFLDEGFGTQDAQDGQHLLDAIRAVQRDFDLILVITHIDELKEAFPVRIEVTRSQGGGLHLPGCLELTPPLLDLPHRQRHLHPVHLLRLAVGVLGRRALHHRQRQRLPCRCWSMDASERTSRTASGPCQNSVIRSEMSSPAERRRFCTRCTSSRASPSRASSGVSAVSSATT